MILLTQLIYAYPGKEAILEQFEAHVLPLIAKHGGELLLRLRPAPDSVISASIDVPTEIHLVRFPDEDALARFSDDEERRRYLDLKSQAVRTVLLIKGAAV